MKKRLILILATITMVISPAFHSQPQSRFQDRIDKLLGDRSVKKDRVLRPLQVDLATGALLSPDGDQGDLEELNAPEERRRRLIRLAAILNPVDPSERRGRSPDELLAHAAAAVAILKPQFLTPRNTLEADVMAQARAAIENPIPAGRP